MMMAKFYKIIFIPLLILLLPKSIWAANPSQIKLSPQAKVSVITVAPGQELYAAFGHSLLWIYDPSNQIDKAYSYGTFDFNTGNFYWKFIKGTLPYTISYATLEQNLNYYRYNENRAMTEQVLDLSHNQKQKLFDHLETNLLPKNREYRYKFFYDNCSTRIRDAIMTACSDSIHLDEIEDFGYITYRRWMNKYLGNHKWAAVGMNIAIGKPADEKIRQFDAAYLPENLRLVLNQAKRFNDGRIRWLVASEHPLFTPLPLKIEKTPFFLNPRFLFSVLLIFTILLTFIQSRSRTQGYWYDKILFGIAGLMGWILVFLWFGTDHGVTNWNRNLLWLLPIHFPFIFFINPRKHKNIIGYYFLFTGMMLCAGLYYVAQYSFDTLPWLLSLLVRAIFHAGFEPECRLRIKKKTVIDGAVL